MEQEEGTVSLPVMWRGKKYMVTVNSGASLKEFGDEIQKLTDVKADTLKLIVPQSSGKASLLLEPFSDEHSFLRMQDTAILKAKSIRMMGVLKDEVDEVLRSAKENQRIVGFEEEEMRMKMRMSYGPFSPPKLPEGQYIFCGFRTLELPGIKLNPPPSEALRRMHMLAADPGIVAIMNKHRWRVGIMTELAPVGYVGISPKCLLGFNKNQGEEISLRLRTDDLKGFRKYDSIKKTLLHELAHMVHTEHDANFYALDKQLNQEATTLDWTRSNSHTLSGVTSWDPNDVDTMLESATIAPRKLGGNTEFMSAGARAASVVAAYHRSARATSATGQEEPDPDDSILESKNEAALIMKNQREERVQLDHGPNPNDCPQDQVKVEPDQDDSAMNEYMESEPYNHEGIVEVEPDPDDTELSPILDIVTTGKKLEKSGREESDTGDAQLHSVDPQLMQSEKYIGNTTCSNNLTDPDVNDCVGHQNHQAEVELGGEVNNIEANKLTHAEPGTEDKMDRCLEISGGEISQPVPEDEELQRIQDPVVVFCNRLNKAIEMLRAEINLTDVVVVMQTLFKIVRNVLENPNDLKYRKLRKANSVIQKNIAKYKAAMEVLSLIGFSEDVVIDEIGKAETYLVLKRDDPGLLWLAKSSLESCIS